MKFWLVIPAAGIGSRMQADRPKQYLRVAGKTVLEHTLDIFLPHPQLKKIILPLATHDSWWSDLPCAQESLIHVISGGKERADSVFNALLALPELGAQPQDWVLVHDAARPLLTHTDLNKLLLQLQRDAVGGLLAYPARDTLKLADSQERSLKTLERQCIWHAVTPQMFRLELLARALKSAMDAGLTVTDEASAVEYLGLQPKLIEGRSDNLKMTRPEDLALFTHYHHTQSLHPTNLHNNPVPL